jgi:hypothetical protein
MMLRPPQGGLQTLNGVTPCFRRTRRRTGVSDLGLAIVGHISHKPCCPNADRLSLAKAPQIPGTCGRAATVKHLEL